MTTDSAQALLTFKDFLERASVGATEKVISATNYELTERTGPISSRPAPAPKLVFVWPRINVYCPHDDCDGARYFKTWLRPAVEVKANQELFVTYQCANCAVTTKTFALRIKLEGPIGIGPVVATKIGEHPALDEKIPNRLLKLVGRDRELFIQGRRAERQGLGIGAFSYYRRVVENQKDQILEKVAEAAARLGHDSLAAEVTAARAVKQFADAIDSIKHALPDTLRVGGHDPLRVLHSALSDGLHNKDDAHCLDYAETIREVLGGLADRISQAKQDEESLRKGISRLMRETGN